MSSFLNFLLPGAGRLLLTLCAGGVLGLASAQAAPSPAARTAERSITEWLARMQEASRRNNYVGTFVVSSSAGTLSSGRIWHACAGDRLVEKVEALTGAPRSTLRRDDEVLTLLPEQRTARVERRQSVGPFPAFLKASSAGIADFYGARQLGSERVAGVDADVVLLSPRDQQRYGYRIWSDKKTGLVVKLQTLAPDGQVLEEAAFSELQIGAPLRPEKLARTVSPPEGWRIERIESVKTTAAAEGWELRPPVPGFKATNCYRRQTAAGGDGPLQCVFSDGLASVSVFVEPYDRQRHAGETLLSAGASLTQTRRLQDWWLTAVGEVPPQTLRAFAQALERRR